MWRASPARLCLLLLTLSLAPALGKATEYHSGGPADEAIWQEPGDIRARNLIDGPGGKDGRPKGQLIFIREDLDQSKPKLWVADATGARWKIKLGSEAQPEVVATRLVWAVGYFADENYYEPLVKVENLPSLSRGREYQSAGDVLYGARLERVAEKNNRLGHWSWFDNPFLGTRELNGLRVMMALIGNWDISSRNNGIGSRQGEQRAYYVSDLGSSFGGPSARALPSRNNVADYEQSVFIRRSADSEIDFAVRSCSPGFAVLATPFYAHCKRLATVVEDIPRADARWIGSLLGQLSQHQIADAFRAAGYEGDELERYVRAVSARISQLEQL